MNDPADILLRAARASPFPPASRYHGIPLAEGRDAAGRAVQHLRRRIVPPPGPTSDALTVAQGDRADLLAAQAFGDPEQAWRLCDANRAMSYEELTARPGRALRTPGGDGRA